MGRLSEDTFTHPTREAGDSHMECADLSALLKAATSRRTPKSIARSAPASLNTLLPQFVAAVYAGSTISTVLYSLPNARAK
jgi:hypothetical protein